jgi:DNA polymerase elongation subunit (family B)
MVRERLMTKRAQITRRHKPNSKEQSDVTVRRKKRRVRMAIESGDVVRFFDLPIARRVSEPHLHRAITEAAQAFAASFCSSLEQ